MLYSTLAKGGLHLKHFIKIECSHTQMFFHVFPHPFPSLIAHLTQSHIPAVQTLKPHSPAVFSAHFTVMWRIPILSHHLRILDLEPVKLRVPKVVVFCLVR